MLHYIDEGVLYVGWKIILWGVSGLAGALFVAYCIYFDRKRRQDPQYKKKLLKKGRTDGNDQEENKLSYLLILSKCKHLYLTMHNCLTNAYHETNTKMQRNIWRIFLHAALWSSWKQIASRERGAVRCNRSYAFSAAANVFDIGVIVVIISQLSHCISDKKKRIVLHSLTSL
ncbi:Mitochondrial import receptor, partial [Trichinella spiralis]